MELNYKDLGLEVDKTRYSFTFGDKEIEVSNYLPAKDKYDLLMVTLQKAYEDCYYNEFKLNVFFKLHLVYMYSNLVIVENDEFKLYDELVSSGFMELFLNTIPRQQYLELESLLFSMAKTISESKRSAGAILQTAIKDLPKNAQAAMDMMKEIDPDKFKEVIKIAQDAKNGNIPLN